jgi:hypothetical protein
MKHTPEKLIELQKKFPPSYPMAKSTEMHPVADFDFVDMEMKELTCKNHPLAVYLTKNPWSRGLHFIQGPNGLTSLLDEECDCPFDDLRVVIRNDSTGIGAQLNN